MKWAVVALLGLACSPEQSNGLASCPFGIETIAATDVARFVAGLAHGTEFDPLSNSELLAAQHLATALVAGFPEEAAARALGFRLAQLQTPAHCYLVALPGTDHPRGQATLIVRATAWRHDLVLEAPHVPYDFRTDEQAAWLFEALEARALLVAGAQRCSSPLSSGCRANPQCGFSSESDPAHAIRNTFQAFHVALSDSVVVQLHSNRDAELNGDLLLSDGTRAANPRVQMLAAELEGASCNDPARPISPDAYCGVTNAQALASNGAADACTGSAAAASGRFLHIEQGDARLIDFNAWNRRIAAALAVSTDF